MAEIPPTKPDNHSGGAPEGKPVSSAIKKRPPSLLEEIVETALWFWGLAIILLKELAVFTKWCGRNPAAALALAGIAATLVYFFAIATPFYYGSISVARWAWEAWNPDGEQSYGRLVPPIAIGLFFYHRDALRAAPKGGHAMGIWPLLGGILLFVAAVRCLNPRMALASVPFLLYGGTRFGWGRAAARVVLFPCVFLIFMVPVAALQQATSHLQHIITSTVGALSHLFGIAILAVGTTLTATDGSFNFEIAEGCSGIRSLMAMMMLTAVFVHLTQDRLWKKVTIFGGSLAFAIVGNIGRIFTIVLLARFYNPKVAAGLYHDYSGYLFFPIAILAMVAFSAFVNLDFKKLAAAAEAKAHSLKKDPVPYDY